MVRIPRNRFEKLRYNAPWEKIMSETVELIGLGLVGTALAERLLAAKGLMGKPHFQRRNGGRSARNIQRARSLACVSAIGVSR